MIRKWCAKCRRMTNHWKVRMYGWFEHHCAECIRPATKHPRPLTPPREPGKKDL